MTDKARTVSRKPEGASKRPGAVLKRSMPASVHKVSAGGDYAVELPSGSRGEVARLAIQSVLGRVSSVPEREATRILEEVRGAAAPEARVMDWLRVEDGCGSAADSVLEAAFRRGDQRKAAILRDPAMLTGEAAAARLGVSRETINKRAQQGRLLALEFAKRGKRYPEWQFEERVAGRPLEGVLAALGSRDAWEQYRFFTQPQPGLGGRTPIEALRRGEVEAVQSAAQGWAAGEQGGG